MSLRFALGIPSEGRVKCSHIEKKKIPTVWTVFLIFVIKLVLYNTNSEGIQWAYIHMNVGHFIDSMRYLAMVMGC